MMTQPFISICIPSYKRATYLKRLLDSIEAQKFKDFEVIVTDDSPDDEVRLLCGAFSARLPLTYYKNERPLGSPGNWNAGMRVATGHWIKLMHDDDWFREAGSLGEFASQAENVPGADFIFCAYENWFLEENRSKQVHATSLRLKKLAVDPVTLFSSNIIGPPSVVMHRNDGMTYYDTKVKWVVDIEFYVRFLSGRKFHYIDKPLVNVGIGSEQITTDCFRQRQVEIPEAFHFLEKTGLSHLRNILVYDGWWRLLRNLEIRKPSDIYEAGYQGKLPGVISSMIAWQKRFSLSWLRNGGLSKSLMFLSYIYNKKRIPS